MTLLTAIERSERLVKSMEARGYDGDITLYGDVPRPPAREVVAVVACYAGIVAYTLVVAYQVIPV
jgi:cobalt/nickel transport system permease protein